MDSGAPVVPNGRPFRYTRRQRNRIIKKKTNKQKRYLVVARIHRRESGRCFGRLSAPASEYGTILRRIPRSAPGVYKLFAFGAIHGHERRRRRLRHVTASSLIRVHAYVWLVRAAREDLIDIPPA